MKLTVVCGLLFFSAHFHVHVHGYGQGKKTRCFAIPTLPKKVANVITSCQDEVKTNLIDDLLYAAFNENPFDQAKHAHALKDFEDHLFHNRQVPTHGSHAVHPPHLVDQHAIPHSPHHHLPSDPSSGHHHHLLADHSSGHFHHVPSDHSGGHFHHTPADHNGGHFSYVPADHSGGHFNHVPADHSGGHFHHSPADHSGGHFNHIPADHSGAHFSHVPVDQGSLLYQVPLTPGSHIHQVPLIHGNHNHHVPHGVHLQTSPDQNPFAVKSPHAHYPQSPAFKHHSSGIIPHNAHKPSYGPLVHHMPPKAVKQHPLGPNPWTKSQMNFVQPQIYQTSHGHPYDHYPPNNVMHSDGTYHVSPTQSPFLPTPLAYQAPEMLPPLKTFNHHPINVIEANQALMEVLAVNKPLELHDNHHHISTILGKIRNGNYDDIPVENTAGLQYHRRSKRSLFGKWKITKEEKDVDLLPAVISHEDRWLAGCLMQCVYRKNNAVDNSGLPTLEGLVQLFTGGVTEQGFFINVLRAADKCLKTASVKHNIQKDKKPLRGETCDVAFDVFDCVSDSITEYCSQS